MYLELCSAKGAGTEKKGQLRCLQGPPGKVNVSWWSGRRGAMGVNRGRALCRKARNSKTKLPSSNAEHFCKFHSAL